MSKLLRSLLPATAILMFSLPSSASVIWTLNDFVFTDGGTAVGQFEWNETTNSLIAWDIDVLPVLKGSPGMYSDTTGAASAFSNPPRIYLNFGYFEEGIFWNFRIGLADLDLLDAPVAFLSVSGNPSAGDAGFLECTNCGNVRSGTAGAFLSAAAVPEPATLTLMFLGLLGLGFRKRKSLDLVQPPTVTNRGIVKSCGSTF